MLDFSGISTEMLENAVYLYDKGNSCACVGINCSDVKCPFSKNICGFKCLGVTHALTHYKAFSEELNRREKDMNEMPELKAGMILELKTSIGQKKLYINDSWIMSLTNDSWTRFDGFMTKNEIVNIYKSNSDIKTYINCTDDLKLIWSRKSDKDIEIEEIQKEMNKLNKRMEGLKSE